MINAIQELSPVRKVLAKSDRIIVFGEDISALGVWEQLLR
jgi:pyruvate/2-oxoglutarate/acetoin dehydrogenase E1 component